MSDRRHSSPMSLESIQAFFDASPSARLLRSDLAPFVIDFLTGAFKTEIVVALSASDLRAQLSLYQEELHESRPDVLTGPPERYLSQWTDAGWLQRLIDAHSNEPQFQLTRFSEEAMRFVDASLARSSTMVGTESRLRLVMETLADIVRGSSPDPQRRLTYLRNRRAAIDEEIASLEAGSEVRVYQPSQIRERFQTAVDLLKALQSDFRAVEERFEQIARDVGQLQNAGRSTRGGILGFALDSEELLKSQDEGVSFYAFVSFLFSPAQQSALLKHIEEIQKLNALSDEHESMERVRRMVPALLAEADKVMRTTARLSASLRRLLDGKTAAHRARLASVLQDIKLAAMKMSPQQNKSAFELNIECEPEIASPFARTFWTPREQFEMQSPTQHSVDDDQLKEIIDTFSQMRRLDLRSLRRHIRELTHSGTSVTLGRIVQQVPIENGVMELLGYLQIAHDDGHTIDDELVESVTLTSSTDGRSPMQITIPRVTFNPKATSHAISAKPR